MTHHHDHGHAAPDMAHDMLRRFVGAAILTVPIVLYSSLGTSLVGRELAPPFGLSHGLLGFVLTSVVVWWGGWPFVSFAWRSLLRGELTMMTLIATGILVSYGYSVAVTFGLRGELFYDAAAMLTAFSLLGHWLEMRSRFATGRAVEALLELAPPTARRVRVGADTALAEIVALVREARSSKAPAQRLADVAGKYLVIVALAAGVVTFVTWQLLGSHGLAFALSAAVAAVVIACPDALALATPTAITVGVGRAARAGVLFKNATVLEAAARVDTVVFDKTGTLTEGRPALADVVPDAGVDEAEVLRLAAAADAQSEHPLAAALVAGAAARAIPVATAHGFEAIPGYGVRASVDGRSVLVGNRKLLERERVAPRLAERAEQLRSEGKTVLYVAAQGRLLGLLAVADRIRPGAPAAVL